MSKPPSLIKWSGSKRGQSEAIAALFPAQRTGTYFEPFLGGGSMLFFGAQRFPKACASDIYAPLVEIWVSVKERPDDVKADYLRDWTALQSDFPDYFYEVRSRFNEARRGQDLLFLSRTCVNGIIRFNSSGEFNNALHLTRRGMKPAKFDSVVDSWSAVLGNTEFLVADYSWILERVRPGDFVYMDPPYANSHNRYVEDLDVERFMSFLVQLNNAGAKWALSFDGVRGGDDFSYAVPEGLYRHKIIINTGHSLVQRVLNGKKVNVAESLYINYEPDAAGLRQLELDLH